MVDQFPILYSFRRCPYAMRARMALLTSGTVCELREVVLRDKPQAMLDLSPKATVPVLQTCDGQVIEESLEIMLWGLRQADPEGWLEPDLEEMLMLIDRNDTEFKVHLDRYKYATRYEDADPVEERSKAEAFLESLEKRLSHNRYLMGKEPTLADYAIFPFIRQFAFTDKDWFDQSTYQKLSQWLEVFLSSEIFPRVMKKYPQWHEGGEVTLFGP